MCPVRSIFAGPALCRGRIAVAHVCVVTMVVAAAVGAAAGGCDDGNSGKARTRAATDTPGQRPDVHYLSFQSRATVTDALESLSPLSAEQRRVLQAALHHHGLKLLGPVTMPLTREAVLATVVSHSADGRSVTFRFSSGAVLEVGQREARTKTAIGSFMFAPIYPLPPQGRFDDAGVERVLGSLAGRFGYSLTSAQRAVLRSKLTTAGAVLDKNEQVMEGDSNVLTRIVMLPDDARRFEFFNGAVLELAADGTILFEHLPWQE